MHIGQRLFFALALCFFCALAPCASAQERTAERFRVQVDVDSQDPIRTQVESLIKRELRTIGDVILVEESPQYILGIMTLPARASGRTTGYFLSVITIRPLDRAMISVIAPGIAQDQHERLVARVTGMYIYLNHAVYSTPENELRETSQEIVSRFDVDILDPVRKARQRNR